MDLEEIRQELLRGDRKLIATAEGCHPNYVGMVLRGERNNASIVARATKLAQERKRQRIQAIASLLTDSDKAFLEDN